MFSSKKLLTVAVVCVLLSAAHVASAFTVDFAMKPSLSKTDALEFMTTVIVQVSASVDPNTGTAGVYPTAIVAECKGALIISASTVASNAADAINSVAGGSVATSSGSTVSVALTSDISYGVATAIVIAAYTVPFGLISITGFDVEYVSLGDALSVYKSANDDEVPGCKSATIEGIPDFIVFLLIHYYILIIIGAVCCCGVIAGGVVAWIKCTRRAGPSPNSTNLPYTQPVVIHQYIQQQPINGGSPRGSEMAYVQSGAYSEHP